MGDKIINQTKKSAVGEIIHDTRRILTRRSHPSITKIASRTWFFTIHVNHHPANRHRTDTEPSRLKAPSFTPTIARLSDRTPKLSQWITPAIPAPGSSSMTLAVLLLWELAIGGTVWHGIKGYRNSPYGERRIGAISAIKMRAPVLGGNFGVWGGLFSTFDCSVKSTNRFLHTPCQVPPRQSRASNFSLYPVTRESDVFGANILCLGLRGHKEDPWNSIAAGFLTGGALAIRGGYKAARNGAIGCALLLAVIEGVGIGFQKMFAGSTKLEMPAPPPSDERALA
ncbi:mitochondrial import inner membrane translocase subunit tim-17 [Colletotrichum salicis]|uniref:Mitochondrial import inner membrane translocase subunit tim-17 n=1 Tax=Colletotrichum salicis TaxID=1209931 RepID=A0A135V083_9PEZI|nr:mitochondrial import inner membrane translocase subunit tim-17 [Colletotrichum salicis]